jgi:hypothetical protein
VARLTRNCRAVSAFFIPALHRNSFANPASSGSLNIRFFVIGTLKAMFGNKANVSLALQGGVGV